MYTNSGQNMHVTEVFVPSQNPRVKYYVSGELFVRIIFNSRVDD